MQTIASIATSTNEGAIGIVRLTGDDSFQIALKSLRKRNGDFIDIDTISHRKMFFCHFTDNDGNYIDEVMAVMLFAPNTYTRENMVEIYSHGGSVSVSLILSVFLSNGARLSNKGEFTLRAFLSGRIDLVQAESVADVVSSKTKRTFELASSQLRGGLSATISGIRARLIELLAQIDVAIDYPEEDIEEITVGRIISELGLILNDLKKLLASSDTGRIIRDGLKVAIIGKPNVGKSSLLNYLLNYERAIVTPIAGTTRDIIEEDFQLEGIPFRLIDTAGIRETDDIVENIGVQRAKETFNDSDIAILLLSFTDELDKDNLELLDIVKDNPDSIIFINKSDENEKFLDIKHINSLISHKNIITGSVKTGDGLSVLKDMLIKLSKVSDFDNKDFISNIRHIDLVKKVIVLLEQTINVDSYDLFDIDIRQSVEILGQITGETASEDLLNQIFSKFCLGK